ncbi:MAG: DUF58 domain-containing protein [Coraliomargarita sp.]
MNWNLIKRQTARSQSTGGVHTDLDKLVRLRFQTSDFSLRPTQPVASILNGRYGSRLRGRGMDFAELRRYQNGDDIRSMDWKVTARTGKPHVRICEEEKDRAVLVVVDQRSNMFFGTRRQMKSVTAAECAAVAVWRALAAGDRAGAVVFNETETAAVRPRRSEANAMAILGHIVRMNQALRAGRTAPPTAEAFNKALRQAASMAPHDVLVVVVSDLAGIDSETARIVNRIAAHNDVITLLTHDASRLDAFNQSVQISDGNQQTEIDFAAHSVRQRLKADFEEETKRIQDHLRRISAPMLTISNAEDTVAQIRRHLGVPAPRS